MRNQLFITKSARYRKQSEEDAFNRLHWQQQLRLRPLNPYNDKTRPAYETGDHDNRTDNWEVGDEPETDQ